MQPRVRRLLNGQALIRARSVGGWRKLDAREDDMKIPMVVAHINKYVTNRVLRHLSGHGPFAEIEHVGRRSGRARRTTLMVFPRGEDVTIALTYGPRVDWLKNARAAGGARLHLGSKVLTLGAPRPLPTEEGLRRMPPAVRLVLRLTVVRDFVEFPVVP